jgi:hypothetical protein
MASRSKRKAKLRSAAHASCPIPNTHRRLEDAHRLWHEALKHYDDPDGFRTFINSAIQELRNVTFVLQKEQFSGKADFEKWYEPWRQRLRNSAPNRLMVDLRNKVVKEGDLATASRVHARFFTGYRECAGPAVFSGPPTASAKGIAASLARTFPPEVRKNALLIVERRWELPGLPGIELLDGLASAYGVLADLVRDAHTVLGNTECAAIDCEEHSSYSRDFLAGRPACMAVSREARTATVDLQRSRFRAVRAEQVALDKGKRGDRLVEEYAKKSVVFPPIQGMAFPDQARALHSYALSLLRADGYLEFTFTLFRDTDLVKFFAARPDERTDLPLVAMRLREEVERTRADRVICSNEMWIGRAKFGHPEDDPERREAVNTTALQSDGFILSLTTPFRREPSGVVFKETTANSKTVLPFFTQLVTYWRAEAK